MTWSHVHKETGRLVGDPETDSISELTGEAPLCQKCRSKPAVRPVDGRDLCGECIDALEGDLEAPGLRNTEADNSGKVDQ